MTRGPLALLCALSLLLATVGCLGNELEEPVIDPPPPSVLERRLTPEGMSASEVSIAADPTDANHVVAAANSEGGFGVYVTWDAGARWEAHRFSPDQVSATGSDEGRFLALSDPVVAFGPEGIVYLSGLAFLPTSAVFVAVSTDGGASFPQVHIVHESDVAGSFNDKEWLAVNPTTGTLLVAWQKEPVLDQLRGVEQMTGADVDVGTIVVARSTDGGESWSLPMRIDRGLHNNGTQIAFTPDGDAHLIWVNYEENTIDHVQSTDDGATFSDPEPIATVDTVPPFPRYQRMHTLPGLAASPVDDTLVVTWHDDRHPDPDVLAVASQDGGETWGEPVRVTSDQPGNGVLQLYPWVTIDPEGRVHVTFYDSRPDPDHPRFGYFHAWAPDGQLAFQPAEQISQATFTVFQAEPGQDGGEARSLGDYTGVAASTAGIFPAWADGRGQSSAIYAAALALP